MNYDYHDIVDQLGAPLWWDERAVPRYCPPTPDVVADIYAEEVAFVEIACQGCANQFLVAFSNSIVGRLMYSGPDITLPDAIVNNTLHYGDPPNVGCCAVGPTMNSVPLRVVEFWERDRRTYLDWKRCEEYEVALEADWSTGWKKAHLE